MSKLNPKQVTPTVHSVAAKYNLSVGVSAKGNLQFVKEPHQMLYELVVSTLFGKGTFYSSSDQLVNQLRTQLKQVVAMGSLDFVANLAVHARGEMNIRTIPIVLVVEFAAELRKTNQQFPQMRRLVYDVIQRADQITDMYAYALDVFGSKNKIPMAIKRGVADAFNKFSEYHYGKYNRSDSVKFKDVLRIVHPQAKHAAQGAVFAKIMTDTLAVPYTWETELSMNGQLPAAEQKSKQQLWTELVQSGKMGYMALLRNLRNIHEAGVPASVIRADVAPVISNPEEVAKSRQLPFDFVQAYHVVKDLDSKLATCVSQALDLSVGNIPAFGNRVWIIIDYSGSMGSDYCHYSKNGSSMGAITTATLLAAALLKSVGDKVDNLAVTLFGSAAKTLKSVDTNQSVLGIKAQLLQHRVGSIAGSTNFAAALGQVNNLDFVPDTIIVLTDGEVDAFPYTRLNRFQNDRNVMKITINLNSAPTTPMIKEDGWYTMAGWSSAMFKWIPAIRDKVTIVEQLSKPYNGEK